MTNGLMMVYWVYMERFWYWVDVGMASMRKVQELSRIRKETIPKGTRYWSELSQ